MAVHRACPPGLPPDAGQPSDTASAPGETACNRYVAILLSLLVHGAVVIGTVVQIPAPSRDVQPARVQFRLGHRASREPARAKVDLSLPPPDRPPPVRESLSPPRPPLRKPRSIEAPTPSATAHRPPPASADRPRPSAAPPLRAELSRRCPRPTNRPAQPAVAVLPTDPLAVATNPSDRLPAPAFPPRKTATASSASTAQAPARADPAKTEPARQPVQAGIRDAYPRRPIHPVYPRTAIRRTLQGRVVVLARVNRRGQVVSATVSESSGHDCLDSAAVRAVLAATFAPALRDGEPVDAEVRVPVRFKLVDE